MPHGNPGCLPLSNPTKCRKLGLLHCCRNCRSLAGARSFYYVAVYLRPCVSVNGIFLAIYPSGPALAIWIIRRPRSSRARSRLTWQGTKHSNANILDTSQVWKPSFGSEFLCIQSESISEYFDWIRGDRLNSSPYEHSKPGNFKSQVIPQSSDRLVRLQNVA
jgi:hypothetical protein